MSTRIQTLPVEVTPEQVFLAWKDRRACVWLDSARVDGRLGRYSLLAAEPFLTFSARGSRWETETAAGERTVGEGDPFARLEELLARHSAAVHTDVPFPLGAAVGYFGYELKNQVERLPQRAVDDVGLPDCWFGFYDSLLVWDHVTEKTYRVGRNLPPIPRAVAWPPPSPGVAPVVTSNFSRENYRRAVGRALEYIAAGDIYQVNLAQRFHARVSVSAPELYLALREANPAPFAAYLDVGGAQILSSSPERFLRISGRHVQTRPIKGTRPRTGDETRDAIAARELMMSAKDQAELVMITDLERNDLGRVCEFGSVCVPELVRLEEYATVFHLVSTVEGRLRPGLSHVAAVRACFPGGSISGAPKIRALQIIDELEPHARGVYTGAIGYFGFNGESDFNIAIRTLIHRRGEVWFHAGGGIVADSDPAAEYEETLAKARGMRIALEQAHAVAPRPPLPA